MANAECLQCHTGECGGCNILNIAKARLDRYGVQGDPELIRQEAERVGEEYCPEPKMIQIHRLMPTKRSVW